MYFHRLLFLFPAAFIAVFAGCAAVGPNYSRPPTTLSPQWNTELDAGLKTAAPEPQALAGWWEVFNDPLLSELIARAALGNKDLKKAEARVRESRALRTRARSALYPTLDVSGSYTNSRGSAELNADYQSELHSASLDAAWELDLFGGVRRSVEAAEADVQALRENLRDVLVTLMAEEALAYIEARTYQDRIAVAEANLGVQQETYELTLSRCRAGLTSELAVQQARYNLASTKSQIPSLRSGLQESMNRMAVLLGDQPGAVHASMRDFRPIEAPPIEIAVGVPADVLRRRPDIRRCERELAAQTARIGEATASLYPKLTLNGSIGLDALSFAKFFGAGAYGYSFGPGLSFPIFDAGKIRANIEVQSALQEQALIAYEAAILDALEEVENALTAYAEEQKKLSALRESAAAARQAVELADQQYRSGMVDFSNLLEAQKSLLSFQDQEAQSHGKVSANLVRLYKALGGGWSPLAAGEKSSGDRKIQ